MFSENVGVKMILSDLSSKYAPLKVSYITTVVIPSFSSLLALKPCAELNKFKIALLFKYSPVSVGKCFIPLSRGDGKLFSALSTTRAR